jgi:tryptophan 2,3-dioxygenase
LKKRFDSPSLADVFWKALQRKGFDVSSYQSRVDSITELLNNPEKEPEIYIMQDLLVDHDENISLWRYHHVLMVERMLGMKKGTGGSEGVPYLRTTLQKKFMPELWEARTHLKLITS